MMYSQCAQLILSGMPLQLPSHRFINTEQYSFPGLEGPMISMLELRSKNPPNAALQLVGVMLDVVAHLSLATKRLNLNGTLKDIKLSNNSSQIP